MSGTAVIPDLNLVTQIGNTFSVPLLGPDADTYSFESDSTTGCELSSGRFTWFVAGSTRLQLSTTALTPVGSIAHGATGARWTQGFYSANPPLVLTSTGLCINLNADLLDGVHVGTSGNTVPKCNTTNGYSATQTISVTGNCLGLSNAAAGALYAFAVDGSSVLSLSTGLVAFLTFSAAAGVVVNEAGAGAVDFRVEGDTNTHMMFVDATSTTENIALCAGAAPNWQTMDLGLFIGDAATVPTGDPANGGFLYSEAGALKWRGSGGTITTLGPA
jgi:hypothetical protein